ncbi:sialidase family protein [Actinoallomurus sp. CA-150999]|uniref:sialidase family protein n=1 Tax=Actinoallomurus sp. CA-150999 TaxID=3239887 RepID=UPI003D8B7A46
MASHNTPLSRRTLLGGAAACGALAAAGPAWRWSGNADAAISSAASFIVPPPNVRVSNDAFDVHVEPHLAANPRDPRNLLGAAIVQRGNARGLATYASFDAGATWRGNGLLPGLTPAYDADVTVAYDQHGRGFVCGIRSATKDLADSSILLWRTDDGGRTFGEPLPIRTGTVDHTWLVASRSPKAPHHLYVAWADGPGLANGLAFSRSTDGGRSFQPPRFLDPTGRVPMTATGPDGTVHIIYQVSQADGSWTVQVMTSCDHGTDFRAPVTVGRVTPPDQPPPGLAVNTKSTPTIAVAPDGTVYAAFPDYDPATAHFTVRLCTSADQGRRWSATELTSSSEVVYLQPMVAVDDHGRLAVSVIAVRRTEVEVQMYTAQPRGTGFRRHTLTSRPFDAALAPDGYLGDHQGLTAAGDRFHPLWNDTRTGRMELFTATLRTTR